MLAARLRKPWPIIAGILIATLANHALAGWAGSLLAGLVPETMLIWIVGLSFIAFGLWALHPDALDGSPAVLKAGAFITTFVAFFLAEMGDKTQLATVALAARFDALAQVIVGTTLGMMIANVPAVWIGDRLAQKVTHEYSAHACRRAVHPGRRAHVVEHVRFGMALTKDPVENRHCLDCGRAFHCGIAADSPCWCATEYPALMPLTDAAAGCYCRECLEKRIAARKSVT